MGLRKVLGVNRLGPRYLRWYRGLSPHHSADKASLTQRAPSRLHLDVGFWITCMPLSYPGYLR